MGGRVIIPPIFKFALFKKLVALITGSVCNVHICSSRLVVDGSSGHVRPGLSFYILRNTILYFQIIHFYTPYVKHNIS